MMICWSDNDAKYAATPVVYGLGFGTKPKTPNLHTVAGSALYDAEHKQLLPLLALSVTVDTPNQMVWAQEHVSDAKFMVQHDILLSLPMCTRWLCSEERFAIVMHCSWHLLAYFIFLCCSLSIRTHLICAAGAS